MSGPHDRFFRYVLEHPGRAAALLYTLLPPGFAARLEWSTLRSQSTTIVDTAIRETRSDLLFSVRLRGSSRRAFILLEHQSSVDGRMAARMLEYVSRLLHRWEQQHPFGGPRPLILPVVLYHGPRGPWTAPRRLEELLEVPLAQARREGWLKHLVRLEYVLYDLMARSERELKMLACPPLVRLALVLLRLTSTRELNRRLMHQVDLFKELYGSLQGRRDLDAVIHYLRERGTKATGKVTRQVLGCVMREQRVEALMWTEGQRLRAEGRRQGREEGRVEGRAEGRVEGLAEGMAEGVLRVLAARAIYVDGESRQRILDCTDPALLDLWLKRASRANHLSEVLARRSVTGKRATRSRPFKAKSGGKTVAGGSPKRGRRQ